MKERVPHRPTGIMKVIPDWVCEITSPGHERKDLFHHFILLQRIKVSYYWVISPENKTLLAYELVDEKYQVGFSVACFEICIFAFDKFGIMKDILTQVAITDVADDSFHFEEYLDVLTLPDDLENRYRLTAGPSDKVRAVGGDGVDQLHLEIGDYVLDLKTKASGPPWLHYLGQPSPVSLRGIYLLLFPTETRSGHRQSSH